MLKRLIGIAAVLALAFAPAAAWARGQDPDAVMAQAHAMHLRLLATPPSARQPADYDAIVALLTPLWQDPSASGADGARYEAAGIELALARDLHDPAAYSQAARQFLDLLHVSPYTVYRRNAEWALAQIQIFHLDEPRAAAVWLRDFERRYPADLRVPLAKQELAGRTIPEPTYLEEQQVAEAVIPPAFPPPAAAGPAPPAPATAAVPPRAVPPVPTTPSHTASLAVRAGEVTGVQVFSGADSTSVVIALHGAARWTRGVLPARHLVYFDISRAGRLAGAPASLRIDDGRVDSVRVAAHGVYTRVTITTTAPAKADRGRLFPNPDRLVVGISGGVPAFDSAATPVAAALPLSAPQPVAATKPAAALSAGGTSLTRALGLKLNCIVLDAGHGGHDTGTIGPGGVEEKNVALDVTLRLGHLLRQRLGLRVVYTRDSDTFIPLQERTAIANRAHADLFLSIHANASPDRAARGIETYYLDLTDNAQAMAVAARENAGSDLSMHDLQGLVQKIAQTDKMQESRELATDLDLSLVRSTGEPDRGVRTAPFVVLIGARMPSVLAEISFLSDPTDSRDLSRPAYRQQLAEALYAGVLRYARSLAGAAPVAHLASALPVQ